MSESIYDYSIIGAGAAGLHLALAMSQDPFFDNKRILLLDKNAKNENDRTWCFWEKGSGKWEDIIDFKWEKAGINSKEGKLPLDLKPYSYKKINSLSFYNYAREALDKKTNFTWLQEDVSTVIETEELVNIKTTSNSYKAFKCFDSRIDDDFSKAKDKYIRILQHFKGFVIEFESDTFDPTTFTMMDFRLRHENSTSFSYVLPINKRKALVEFTLFTADLLPMEAYDPYIKNYISNYISKEKYRIEETEYGVIPMTNYPFHKSSSKNILKIGTAGSWVRASSGYSFKYAEKNVRKIINNIKHGRKVNKGVLSKKFRLYDTLLLDIMNQHNELGPVIFTELYSTSSPNLIFKFLDGETSFFEDFRIISKLKPWPFLKALFRVMRPLLLLFPIYYI